MAEDDSARRRGQMSTKLTRRHKIMASGVAGVTGGPTTRRTCYEPNDGKDDYVQLTTRSETGGPLVSPRERKRKQGEDGADTEAGSRSSRKGIDWPQQRSIVTTMFARWVNLLLVFVPIGLFCRYAGSDEVLVFSTNFLAIIPLASLLGAATEHLSNLTGQLVGGLLNATFGNAVEMIMCIQSVKAGLITVVKGNLLGSVLSNLLLVLGMAIVASGVKRKQANFNAQGAAANMTCQLVASISVCLPTVFDTVGAEPEELLQISRICSVLLVVIYGLFLYFVLGTHSELFEDQGEEEEEQEETLHWALSVLLLLACTICVWGCSDALVDCIEDVSENYGLSKAFIGVILLPIVGNAAEHATAVSCAYNGMMDLALGVAVGSSTQIALFVVPVAVLFGAVYDQPMDLNFTLFDTTCQMLTVFLVSQVLQHGSTNWLHGAMLMSVYFFIAIETLYIRKEEDTA